MKVQKRIALVAHDNRKKDIIEWVEWNFAIVSKHKLVCTGTTGKLVIDALKRKIKEENSDDNLPEIIRVKSGPLGGDQQIGAMIAEGKVDMMIFLWDPMQPQPHDVDVKALLRLAAVYNIPIATNRSTADFLISSPIINQDYEPVLKDYSSYIKRSVDT